MTLTWGHRWREKTNVGMQVIFKYHSMYVFLYHSEFKYLHNWPVQVVPSISVKENLECKQENVVILFVFEIKLLNNTRKTLLWPFYLIILVVKFWFVIAGLSRWMEERHVAWRRLSVLWRQPSPPSSPRSIAHRKCSIIFLKHLSEPQNQ